MTSLFHPHPTPLPKGRGPDLKEKLAWLRLARTENVGPITFYNFIEYYGSAEKALAALPDLTAKNRKGKPLTMPALAVIEKEYERLRKAGGDIITAADPAYPLALAALEDAPPVLSVLGNPALLSKPGVAIVGSRNASLNGKKFASMLAKDLGDAGQAVISGMARGIDTAAHEGALLTEGGTIAVVAGGLDIVYPLENRKLYDEIHEKGLIVAESPLGQKPFAQSFPRRNRIVSGISAGVIVVEANMRSGSLITARLAGEQGRDVFAVPGHPLDPRAQGTNHLIREGAVLVRSAEDVLEHIRNFEGTGMRERTVIPFTPEFDFTPEADLPAPDAESAQGTLMQNLSYSPVHMDELVRASGLETKLVQALMIEMELDGTLQRLPGNRVVLKSEG